MRRDARRKNQEEMKNKIFISGGIALIIVFAIVASITMYGKQMNKNAESQLNADKIASLVPNNQVENAQSASSTMGKSIEESQKEQNTIGNNVVSNKTTNTVKEKSTTTKQITPKKETNTKENNTKPTSSEVKKEISFTKPVEGEISKNYAKDNLIYSNTLKEWVTHLGIDIKADKTTVVKASAEGTVKSIKNDPRYGLTIVISHQDGLQTVYSNLLTSEFVVEGEKVKQGQSIGTVGNSAVFEIADESHLHFEIIKDSVQIDPNIYIK